MPAALRSRSPLAVVIILAALWADLGVRMAQGASPGQLSIEVQIGTAVAGFAAVTAFRRPHRDQDGVLRPAGAALTFFVGTLALLGVSSAVGRPGVVLVGAIFGAAGYGFVVLALSRYVRRRLAPRLGGAGVLDIAVVVVSVLTMLAPWMVGGLVAAEGYRGLVLGIMWAGGLTMFVAIVWLRFTWVGAGRRDRITIFAAAIGAGLVLESVRNVQVVLGGGSTPWWWVGLFGPLLWLITLVPHLSDPPLTEGGPRSWSSAQIYLTYVPAAVCIASAAAVTVLGSVAVSSRLVVVGALVVSSLVLVRQLVLLNDQRIRLRRRSEEALRDSLTGLYNRRAFDEDLATMSSGRRGAPFLLLLADVDELKSVNDGPGGHHAGDRVLREVAAALVAAVRGGDRAYRLGGDEFAVVLPSGDRALGERVLARAAAALEEAGSATTFSAAVSLHPDDGSTPGLLFAAADRRLYRAKAVRKLLPAGR